MKLFWLPRTVMMDGFTFLAYSWCSVSDFEPEMIWPGYISHLALYEALSHTVKPSRQLLLLASHLKPLPLLTLNLQSSTSSSPYSSSEHTRLVLLQDLRTYCFLCLGCSSSWFPHGWLFLRLSSSVPSSRSLLYPLCSTDLPLIPLF